MAGARNPQDVSLFNTLTRKIERLEPKTPGEVQLYCCGPTVYNYQHIGNLRTYIFEDVLVRVLRYAGYNVRHVMNITDVGHLVSDADEGEDKMLVATKREGKTSAEIAEFYTNIFFDHCAELHISRPDIVCKATEHITEMIDLIKRLEERGAAYVSGGNVYFDVSKSPDYGKLAGLDLDSLKSGARIEVDSKKRSPLDFALWFTKSKFEKQEMQWDSPWGRGYPGWHIECSAMSMKYLGESFDIHCGGIDHIPVHHTNEIAQSETATGQPFAKLWMHGGFLVVGADKMSKSTGGFLTLDRLTEKSIDPISYRLFCFSGSYRNELSWSWQAVESAASSLKRMKQAVFGWKRELGANPHSEASSPRALEILSAFDREITNDLGMPKALAVLHEMLRDDAVTPAEKLGLFLRMDSVLGLGVANWTEASENIPEAVQALAAERDEARKTRNWQQADVLRAKIAELGFLVEDSKDGPKLKKKD
ncbi:MAG: cysteine--tRNA ligase [Bdellovibrionota bacterium]